VIDPDAIGDDFLDFSRLASLDASGRHVRRSCDGTIVRRVYSPPELAAIRSSMTVIELEG
jgi:hypothetical protein